MRPLHLSLWGLLALYWLPELLLQLTGMSGGNTDVLRRWLYQQFSFWPGLLSDWTANYSTQPITMFFTYGFLHAGLGHLAVNSMTLVSLGRRLIADVGVKRFALVYLAGLAGGAIGYALLSTRPLPMIGASGALFGLAGAVIWRQALDNFAAISVQQALNELAWPIGLLIALNVVMYVALDGQLAWEAHLGGALAGGLVMALTSRKPRFER